MTSAYRINSARTAEPRWAPARRWPAHRVPERARRWLFDSASLTRRVQQACPGDARVRLLDQRWARPLHSEVRVVDLQWQRMAMVREVFLECDATPWVFARTVIPPRTLHGPARRLARLGERSLGAVLFADPRVTRGEVEIARVVPGDRLHDRLSAYVGADTGQAWARRSRFAIRGRPLLVTEVFLSALIESATRRRRK